MKPRLFGQSYAFQGFWTPINEITHREYPIDLFIEVHIQELIHEMFIATMKVTNNKISALGVSVVLMMNSIHGRFSRIFCSLSASTVVVNAEIWRFQS
jgi:hypothetical protein